MEAEYCFYVEIIPAEGGLRRLPLPTNEDILAGRSLNRCRLLLNDPLVSRVHLRIRCDDNQRITVTDMHTANGSKLDGRALESGFAMTWLINQPIEIGKTHLILRYGTLED